MKKLIRLLHQGDFQIILFCLSLLAFVWPFLGTSLAQSPSHLFLYLFIAWGLIIVLHFLASFSVVEEKHSSEEDGAK